MEDYKIKKALSNAFDDFEISPNIELFGKINNQLQQKYAEQKATNRKEYFKYFFLFTLVFSLTAIGTFFGSEYNYSSIESSNNLNSIKQISTKNTNNSISIDKKSYKKNETELVNNQLIINEIEEKNVSKNTKNNRSSQLNTTRIVQGSIKIDQNLPLKLELDGMNQVNATNEFHIDFSDANNKPNLTNQDFKLADKDSDFESSSPIINPNNLTTMDGIIPINVASNLHFLQSKNYRQIVNYLNNRDLPQNLKNKVPKKELPKINKTTPLAIELSFNPFYAFQKIEPTEAGLANIQNISTKNITSKQRQGFSIHAGYVLNWTKQSRLRLGLSYRDIFQKVDYEQATDVYDFQTINNQTVLVRKGIPYSEEKRNQLIGFKADRQFFMQLSTPTRFYASIGAEYTKALKGKTQLFFVNSTMGIDLPIKDKWRIQLEPSYSYALLGTTDARKNVNINPNHIGLKFGVLYEVRK